MIPEVSKILHFPPPSPKEASRTSFRRESAGPVTPQFLLVATYHQPSATECLYSTQALPDGNFVHCITDTPSGMVGNIIGSQRCLSSCTHTCQPSDVPVVHLPEHHLPVSVPSLWPLHGTPRFHPNHQGVSGSPTSTTCTHLHLFG